MVDQDIPEVTRRLMGSPPGMDRDITPPYHLRAVDFIFASTMFDRAAARAALPPSLDLPDDAFGCVVIYSAPTGWGLAPYTGFFIGIGVKGHDSADGSPAIFMAHGLYSGRAGEVLPRDYNGRLQRGWSRQWREGELWCGEAGTGDDVWLRLAVRQVAERTPATAGTHRYLGQINDMVTSYPIAFSTEFIPIEVTRFEITEAASPLVRSLRPLSFTPSLLCPDMALTFGVPAPLGADVPRVALSEVRMSLLDLLSRVGRPAALVTPTGRIIFVNDEAEALLSGALQGGILAGWTRSGGDALRHVLADATAQPPGKLADPVTLDHPGQARPVLALFVPVSPTLAGEPAILVLFADPSGRGGSDPTAALQLLGLTPAEARIATLVGRGLSAREAAGSLSITENTARSTLKVIYQKLAIAKQSELARVVTRLEAFGAALGPALRAV